MRPEAGQTERELAEAVRDWASGLPPRIPEAERQGWLPADIVEDLGKLGVLGMNVPEADGGLGGSTVVFALVLEELAAAWPSLAVGVSVNSGIVAGSIVRYGTPGQRARWLPLLIDGSGLGAFALTEAGSGSDAASLRASARRDGDDWVLNGRKQFITNARYAPLVITFARVGTAEDGVATRVASRPGAPTPGAPAPAHAGITAFIVPTDAQGVSLGPSDQKMGLLASDTSSLVLDDVRLGADAVLGEVGKGFGIALAGLDGGRIGIAAQAIGISRVVIERAIAYGRERRQFGQPIVEFDAIRFSLARARTDLDAARLLNLRAAWLRDLGQSFTREASMAKLFASEAAQRVTYQALQVFGGYGYMREFEVERYARDARATTIYEGTSEVQRMVIARSLVAA
ncbi:MAG TPA: acyl-CoA dehydrogenase family protein [Candidatus Limnocylindria bacterium]|nr:acyl-CoA dehydrogenase family protein [Candidatus Limnocylindria bacterium]